MPDFVTLTCPSCDAQLKIPNDINRFACRYCGCENIVNRDDDVISLSRFTKQLKQAQQTSSGVDRMASELAITRLRKEIEDNMIMIRKLNKADEEARGCFLFPVVYALWLIGGLLVILFGIGLVPGWQETFIEHLLSHLDTLGVFLVGVLLIFIAGKVFSYITNGDSERAKPYRDTVAQKIKEIEFHKNIVDN